MGKGYRSDIDGLRALAIIPVILFHSGIAGFPGGYVGVDVFFVISGFLITKILIADLEENQYSIVNFYSRRIKRILPALLTVLLAATAFAMWLMFSGEFKAYQSNLISTLFFYSNYSYMYDTAYFAPAAESNPLLHMWSLAVEEQFYIVFPIYLYLMFRFFKNHIFKLTVLLLLMSFIYSIYISQDSAKVSFYSTPSRAWELLLGSVLAFVKEREINLKKWLAETLVIVGLLSIIFSIISYSQYTIFPGLAAAVPVIGTGLIIFVGSYQKTFIFRMLSLKPMVFIGLISYSLYLWHWPILVFYKKITTGIESQYGLYFSIAMMFILAYLSWRFIEVPFRKGKLLIQTSSLLRNYRVMLLLLGTCFILYFSIFNFQKTLSPEVEKILYANHVDNKALKLKDCETFNTDEVALFSACTLGDASINRNTFAIIGDSHGQMLLEGLDASAKEFGRKGLFIGKGGCLPLVGAQQASKRFNKCKNNLDGFLKYLESNPNIKDLLLISRWSVYANQTIIKTPHGRNIFIKDKQSKVKTIKENQMVFDRAVKNTLDAFNKLGVNVYVLRQIPDSQYSAKEIALAKIINPELVLLSPISKYKENQKFVNHIFDKHQTEFDFQIISPANVMCDMNNCKLIDNDGVSVYRDIGHVTSSYGVKIKHIFDAFFESKIIEESF